MKTKLIIGLLLVSVLFIGACAQEKITNVEEFYNMVDSILVWDGVSSDKKASIEIFFNDVNNNPLRFENIEIPLDIQIYTETTPGSKEKSRLIYNAVHKITNSDDRFILIPKDKLNYQIGDPQTGITSITIEKPDGTKISKETSYLPLHLLLR